VKVSDGAVAAGTSYLSNSSGVRFMCVDESATATNDRVEQIFFPGYNTHCSLGLRIVCMVPCSYPGITRFTIVAP
jgi:hypothetical protein